MSKVYSFRLSDDNPREAQAREVIKAWAEEGYSLRYVLVEALITFDVDEIGQDKLNSLMAKLQDMVSAFEKPETPRALNSSLPNSFLIAMKQTAKEGVKAK